MKALRTGDRVEKRRTVGKEQVDLFTQLVGDMNPIHSDPEAARAAGFKGAIAHGMVAGSLFSEILGNDLPGPGAIYLEQSFKFVAPLYVGTEVSLVVEVVHVREDQKIVQVSTTCMDDSGQVCVQGVATLLRRDVSGAGSPQK